MSKSKKSSSKTKRRSSVQEDEPIYESTKVSSTVWRNVSGGSVVEYDQIGGREESSKCGGRVMVGPYENKSETTYVKKVYSDEVDQFADDGPTSPPMKDDSTIFGEFVVLELRKIKDPTLRQNVIFEIHEVLYRALSRQCCQNN